MSKLSLVKTTKLPGAGVGTAVALGAGTAVALGAGTAVALGGADVASGTAVSDPQAITSRIRAATIARIAVDLIMSECLLPK